LPNCISDPFLKVFMPIHSLYRDFFRFLSVYKKREDPFEAYQHYYLNPHKRFLTSYWKHFRYFDERQIENRVRSIKPGDYSLLQELLFHNSPEKICLETLKRCLEVKGFSENKEPSQIPPEPHIYLFVGFFSADGFVLKLDDIFIMGFGLERYKSFKSLPIIFTHEYGHYLQKLGIAKYKAKRDYREGTVGEFLLSEGLAFSFSIKVFPERKLFEHLFLSYQTCNWCIENERRLMEKVRPFLDKPAEYNSIYFIEKERNIPSRSLNYVAYKLLER